MVKRTESGRDNSSGLHAEEEEKRRECVLSSCLISDTNKLRQKLGLNPLTEKNKPKLEVDSENSPKPLKDSVEENLVSSKAREILLQEPDIAATADSSDIALYSWIAKSRAFDRIKQTKQFPQPVVPTDEEGNSDENLPNLRVAHDISIFKALKPGQDVILTLEDSCILNRKGELQETEPVLENPSMALEERRSQASKQRKYDPVNSNLMTDSDSLVMNKPKEILPHYDEWLSMKGPTNYTKDSALTRPSFTLSDIHQSEDSYVPSKPLISLTSTSGLQSDFMNAQELENYRRKTKNLKFGATSSQKRKILQKMMKRKRQNKISNLAQEEEDTEKDFILPLLSQHKQQPAVIGLDDVDLENTLLYTQLSKRLPRAIPLQNENARTQSPTGSVSRETLRKTKEDPAALILQNVSLLTAKEQSVDNPNGEGSGYEKDDAENLSQTVESSDQHVEFSDITEFCRSLETPLEKIKSLKEDNATYRHGLGIEKTHREKSWRTEISAEGNEDVDEEMASCLSNEELDHEEGITEEQKRIIHEVLDEEVLDGGLVSALKFLKCRGELSDAPRRRCKNPENVPLHMASNPNTVKLEYKDEYGRVMTPKEAFRYISWIFHGKGPGKKKKEKMLRKMELEKKLKGIASNPSQLLTIKALQKQQKKGQAHLVLTRTT